MSNIELANDENHIGLIQQMPCGRIRQIGTTKEQQMMLQMVLGSLSQDKPMVALPEQYDLVLKSDKDLALKITEILKENLDDYEDMERPDYDAMLYTLRDIKELINNEVSK